jgi:hypothetical protein
MTTAERIAHEAAERVRTWTSLSAEDRAALVEQITPLRSGGAMASINGVDIWHPSWRDAADELAAHQRT